MKKLLIILSLITSFLNKTAAQQNWAAVPCFELKEYDAIGRIFYNEANNELLLLSNYSYQTCNVTYKGVVAYNGTAFHDMDLGIDVHDPNPALGYSPRINDCVEYNGKAIITGGFSTVGSDTLYSRCIAIWNGQFGILFLIRFWSNSPTPNNNVGISKLLKDDNKIWIFAGYDSLGILKFKPILYDGLAFTAIPPVPVNNPSAIYKAIKYQNKLIVMGNFYNSPNFDWFRLAQFDGTSWSQMGTGVRGMLTGPWEMTVYKDTLYVAGNFSKADGNAGNYIMKWDGTQWLDAGFGENWCGYSWINRLLTFRNRLYAFGGFQCAAGQNAFGVAYYENGQWIVPQDSVPGIIDAAVYNDAIYVGGAFKSVNGDTTIQKFAKLMCPDFDAATGCVSGLKSYSNKVEMNIFPNPATNEFIIKSSVHVGLILTITNMLGQQMLRVKMSKPELTVNCEGWANGVYIAQLSGGTGSQTIKLIKD